MMVDSGSAKRRWDRRSRTFWWHEPFVHKDGGRNHDALDLPMTHMDTESNQLQQEEITNC